MPRRMDDASGLMAPKRYLVIVRAGDRSLHPNWLAGPGERTWDLVVSYFGDHPDRFRSAQETRVDDKGSKWQGLHALLSRDDFWRRYDYVWLPDDDLATDTATVNALFRQSAELDLAICQPALSWKSHFSHPVTIRHPSFSVRWTNFVEVMAPCFERRFLDECLPSFGETMSGWGLDWLWPHRLPPAARRCAVIDAVQVTHTRAIGAGTSYQRLAESGISAEVEGQALLRKHAFVRDGPPRLLAALDAQGRTLDASVADDAQTLQALVSHDWAAFLAQRQQLSTAHVVVNTTQKRYGW